MHHFAPLEMPVTIRVFIKDFKLGGREGIVSTSTQLQEHTLLPVNYWRLHSVQHFECSRIWQYLTIDRVKVGR